jgi:hypothetical protein
MADGTLTRGTIVAAIQLGAPTAGLKEALRHDGGRKEQEMEEKRVMEQSVDGTQQCVSRK